MERLLLALAGHPASGKSTLAEYFAKEHGFATIAGSSVIKQYAEAEGLDLSSRSNYDRYHKQLKAKLGKDVLMDPLLNIESERLAIDGLRNYHDFWRFKQAGGLVIALACPLPIRYQRYLKREPSEPAISFAQFKANEAQEYCDPNPNGSQTSLVMASADYELDTFSYPMVAVKRNADLIVKTLTKV